MADSAAAHHFEHGRATALAAFAGTSAAVWSPELLLASAVHRSAATRCAGVRVQATVRLYNTAGVGFLQHVANQVAVAVENALAFQELTTLKDQLAQEKPYLEEESRTEHHFGQVVGESSVLRRVLKEVETVAPTDSTGPDLR